MVTIWVYFGAGIALALSLGVLFRNPDRPLSSIPVSRFFLFLTITLWMTATGVMAEHPGNFTPAILLLGSPAILLSAPLLYAFFDQLLEESFRFRKKHLVHLLPGGISACIIAYSVFMSDRNDYGVEADFIWNTYSNPNNALIFFTGLVLNGYFVMLLHKYSFLRKREYLRDEKFFYSLLVMVLCEVGALILLYAAINGDENALVVAASPVTVNLLIVYVLSQRYPELIQNLAFEARQNRYRKSTLNNVDLASLKRKLEKLMLEEKLFCDEDLSLAILADELGVSAHQLSEYLNEKEKKNFNAYVNGYRINEAAKILVNEPDRSSLSVAMAVGFNSVSVFYSVFRKTTGITPGEYRARHVKTSSGKHP